VINTCHLHLLRIAGSVLLLFPFLGCAREVPHPRPLDSSWVVTRPGVYELAGSNLSIEVKVVDGIVVFPVRNQLDEIVIKPNLVPSDYSRWVMGWNESTQTLWLGSSDIGDYAWFKNESGGFQRKSLVDMDKNEVRTAPTAFREELPEKVQELYESKLNE